MQIQHFFEIWSFFTDQCTSALAELDEHIHESYSWVIYIYIDSIHEVNGVFTNCKCLIEVVWNKYTPSQQYRWHCCPLSLDDRLATLGLVVVDIQLYSSRVWLLEVYSGQSSPPTLELFLIVLVWVNHLHLTSQSTDDVLLSRWVSASQGVLSILWFSTSMQSCVIPTSSQLCTGSPHWWVNKYRVITIEVRNGIYCIKILHSCEITPKTGAGACVHRNIKCDIEPKSDSEVNWNET